VEQISTCSLWKGPQAGAGGCLKEAVTLWGAHAEAGSCQDLWTHGERSPRRSRFAGRACDLPGGPTLEQSVPEDCTPWEGPMLGWFVENGLLLVRPCAGAKEECEAEEVAETTCDELTTAPIPCPPALLGGRR